MLSLQTEIFKLTQPGHDAEINRNNSTIYVSLSGQTTYYVGGGGGAIVCGGEGLLLEVGGRHLLRLAEVPGLLRLLHLQKLLLLLQRHLLQLLGRQLVLLLRLVRGRLLLEVQVVDHLLHLLLLVHHLVAGFDATILVGRLLLGELAFLSAHRRRVVHTRLSLFEHALDRALARARN